MEENSIELNVFRSSQYSIGRNQNSFSDTFANLLKQTQNKLKRDVTKEIQNHIAEKIEIFNFHDPSKEGKCLI